MLYTHKHSVVLFSLIQNCSIYFVAFANNISICISISFKNVIINVIVHSKKPANIFVGHIRHKYQNVCVKN